MKADQANRISLPTILSILGHHPAKQNGHEYWYYSPFRNEQTPSFHLHLHKNIWYDFGEEKGGTVVDFVKLHLERNREDHTVSDALRWMTNMSGATKAAPVFPTEKTDEASITLTLKDKRSLNNKILTRYLQSRGIPASMAGRYLKQAQIHNKRSGKTFLCLAFRNEDGGHELRNEGFKGSLAPKDITFIRGALNQPREIHVFEGFMDFLSVLTFKKKQQLDDDAIILNSTSCLSKALPYLKGYGYKTLYSWMDNDEAGKKAQSVLAALAKVEKIDHKPMNKLFEPYKDVNLWLIHSLKPGN